MTLSEQALLRELAGEIKNDTASPLFRRKAVIQTVQTAGGKYTCTIRLGGSTTDIPGVPCLESYAPTAGDVVEVIRDGPQLFIIGKIGSDVWHEVGAAGEPGFLNSWVNYLAGYPTAAFRRLGNVLQMRGLIKAGVLTASVFTLPLGYRPTKYIHTVTLGDGAAYGLRISNDGSVFPGTPGASNGYVSLEVHVSLDQG